MVSNGQSFVERLRKLVPEVADKIRREGCNNPINVALLAWLRRLGINDPHFEREFWTLLEDLEILPLVGNQIARDATWMDLAIAIAARQLYCKVSVGAPAERGVASSVSGFLSDVSSPKNLSGRQLLKNLEGDSDMHLSAEVIAVLVLLGIGLVLVARHLQAKPVRHDPGPSPQPAVPRRWVVAVAVRASGEDLVEKLRTHGWAPRTLLNQLADHVEFFTKIEASAKGRLDDLVTRSPVATPSEYDRFVVVFEEGPDIPDLSANAPSSYARQDAFLGLADRRCTASRRLDKHAIEGRDFVLF